MNLILEFDDFNPKESVNCIDCIDELISIFPEIKLTMFTSALYERNALFSDKEWCSKVKKHINNNNLRLAIHGLYHTQEEFKNKSYDDAKLSLIIAESVFSVADLPFIKVFRGPHWGINENTYESLIELQYGSVFSHLDYSQLAIKYKNKIKTIFYNWNLKDQNPGSATHDIIIGHGHTHNVCGNGIQESLNRICSFVKKNKPSFLFANEI